MPTESKEHWHLKREVNVSHILVTLSMAAGLISWGLAMDKRVTIVEQYQQSHDKVHIMHDQRHKESYESLAKDIREVKEEIRENRQVIVDALRGNR